MDGGFEIDLVGEVAKMIALPDKAGSAESGDYAGTVKLVARAGYQRYLHIAEGWLPLVS